MIIKEYIKRNSLFGLGRLNRTEYLRNIIISFVIQWGWFAPAILVQLVIGDENWKYLVSANSFVDNITTGILIIFLIIGWIVGLYATIQRLHDLNHSGWWSFVFAIPFINIAFTIYVFAMKGVSRVNKYGAPKVTFVDLGQN